MYPGTAQLYVVPFEVDRVGAAAKTVARFQQQYPIALRTRIARGDDAGKTAADYNDVIVDARSSVCRRDRDCLRSRRSAKRPKSANGDRTGAGASKEVAPDRFDLRRRFGRLVLLSHFLSPFVVFPGISVRGAVMRMLGKSCIGCWPGLANTTVNFMFSDGILSMASLVRLR